MKRRNLFLSLVAVAVVLGTQLSIGASGNGKEIRFKVRIENISSPDGQTAADGSKWPFALSPGMWVAHGKEVTLFKSGKPAPANGLEAQAEDGDPEGLIQSLNGHHDTKLHGFFNTPAGANGPGPIGPGGAYEFSFTATSKMKLSLILMFGQSNDLFYAPEEAGIELFDKKGNPISGDVTSKIILWDAGTEVNQEPGVGPDQAPRQKARNTGAAENGMVRRAKDSPFYNKTGELFRVAITPES
ncbi:MAG TPA: spondin domain-containing protein [Blastocatellia bacterium]|nr:spondin domain-containing protein [Blastocatellia bacterium]